MAGQRRVVRGGRPWGGAGQRRRVAREEVAQWAAVGCGPCRGPWGSCGGARAACGAVRRPWRCAERARGCRGLREVLRGRVLRFEGSRRRWRSPLLSGSQVLLELARNRNKIPLPKSIAPPGSIPLPPEQDTLISPNYQLLIPRKEPPQVEEMEDHEDAPNPNPNQNPSMIREQRTNGDQQQSQQTPQRVSLPLAASAAAAKRPR